MFIKDKLALLGLKKYKKTQIYIYISVCLCVCVSVCVSVFYMSLDVIEQALYLISI